MFKIGIPANLSAGTVGIPASYFNFFGDFDSEVIMLPPEHSFREDLDLLVLLGGADVNPVRYGGVPTVFTGAPDPAKEYFDTYWLPEYIAAGVPVFGICRGHQTLNVHFGGTLKEVNHPTNSAADGSALMHKLFGFLPNLIPDFDLGKSMSVNSRHHQGYTFSSMSSELVPLFHFGGIIEAAAHPELPIVSVQWHPEDIYDNFSIYAISKLLETKASIINEKIFSQVKKQELQLRAVKA